MKRKKRTCRHIEEDYKEYFYKPKSVPITELNVVTLTKDELEALRLVDGCHQSQSEAAVSMKVSSSTLQRIIERAREKVVLAIVNGDAIKIEGGIYKIKKGGDMPRGNGMGPEGKGPGTGRGLGKKSGNKSGEGRGKGRGKGRGTDQKHHDDHDHIHEDCNEHRNGRGRNRCSSKNDE